MGNLVGDMKISGKNGIIRKLDDYGLTEFQKKVLKAALDIPKGEVRTYKQIAKSAGRPRACMAVGTALGRNPLVPIIPCHRVIRSDGKIGNYSGSGGARRKAELLKAEDAI